MDKTTSPKEEQAIEQLRHLAAALCSTVIDGVPGVAMAALAGDARLLAETLAQGADSNMAIDDQGWHKRLDSSTWKQWQLLPGAEGSAISLTTMPDAARGIFEGGDRALAGAAMMGKRDCVAILLSAGADPLAENAQGLTPLDKMLDLNALAAWDGIHAQIYREIVADLSLAMACGDPRSPAALTRAAHRFEIVFSEMHLFTQVSNQGALKRLMNVAEVERERCDISATTETPTICETVKRRL